MDRAFGRNSISRLRLSLETRTIGVDVKASGVGLFAQINWVFHLTRHAHDRGLQSDIRLQSPNYLQDSDDKDWLGKFFVRKNPARKAPALGRIVIRDLNELKLKIARDLNREESNALFFKYYGFQPSITDYVDKFSKCSGAFSQSIGVHYRGTDKTDEAPRVHYEAVEAAVRGAFAKDNALQSIFVASDEAAFLQFMTQRFSDKSVSFFPAAARSADATPLHLQDSQSGSTLGRDAVADALALSKCRVLVRTSSFLSAWSCIFNPAVEVRTLNKPFASKTWFPERMLSCDGESII